MICDQVLQLDRDPPGSPGAKFPMPHWIRHVTVMLRFFFKTRRRNSPFPKQQLHPETGNFKKLLNQLTDATDSLP